MTEFQTAAAETHRFLTALYDRLTAAGAQAQAVITDPAIPAADIAKHRANILSDAVQDARGSLSFLLTYSKPPLPEALSGGTS